MLSFGENITPYVEIQMQLFLLQRGIHCLYSYITKKLMAYYFFLRAYFYAD